MNTPFPVLLKAAACELHVNWVQLYNILLSPPIYIFKDVPKLTKKLKFKHFVFAILNYSLY